jgi:hypothetical protein
MTTLQHPRLREISDYLNSIRGELARVVETTSAEVMNRAPAGERWSGTQIIQHLGKVEGSTTKLLEGVFAKAVETALPDESATSSLMDTLDRFAEEGAILRPLVAPQRLRPDSAPDLAASWDSLRAVRERTYRAYAAVDGKDLTTISAPHPFFGPLSAYEWLLFLGKHEERHLGQLRRELATLGQP